MYNLPDLLFCCHTTYPHTIYRHEIQLHMIETMFCFLMVRNAACVTSNNRNCNSRFATICNTIHRHERSDNEPKKSLLFLCSEMTFFHFKKMPLKFLHWNISPYNLPPWKIPPFNENIKVVFVLRNAVSVTSNNRKFPSCTKI